VLVGGLEVDLATDGGDTDRVPVVADAGDRPVEEIARSLRGELAEAQRVEDRDRPGAEREDVAEDSADARRRALERLHCARVIVRLDLEHRCVAGAQVHRAGVLPGSHQHARALRRQLAKEPSRVLVGAVLRPEQREHRQLDPVRLALEQLDDPLVLEVGQPERSVGCFA
jgi:hypothetical protein